MERYFLFDNLNTWLTWNCYLTSKNIDDPTPNTNYVKLDGVHGSLDLSESLTGEITYSDRIITATFWTDYGTYKERETLLRKITSFLHGKKFHIVEPDDIDHYFYGRVKITSKTNVLSYATFTIEATCEPWRYATDESTRYVEVNGETVDVVINNNGDKTISPEITVTGSVDIAFKNGQASLIKGSYKIPDLKLYAGANVIRVSGSGAITFTYKEATL